MSQNWNHFYVQRRSDGAYAGRRGGADRASYTGATQRDVIGAIRRKQPSAAIHVARERYTRYGKPDQWR